jgi:predicted HTH transcriptional regulator
MDWKEKAIETLNQSLHPVPIELNELDWKSELSPKIDRLAQHLSAFANLFGGGYLVFGVKNDGSLNSVTRQTADTIVSTIGNIAVNNLNHPIAIQHFITDYEGFSLLFIHIPEHNEKPVYIKGNDIFNSYIRSAGQTVKMSPNQVKMLISVSQGLAFENIIALDNIPKSEVLKYLNTNKMYELIDKNIPRATDTIITFLKEYNFCSENNGKYSITNLGALLFANDINKFQFLKNRSVIVRKYIGSTIENMEIEQIGAFGYAIGIEGLVDFIMKHTIKGEIRDVLRTDLYTYPKIAIREFIVNALIHQDFSITGMPLTIEIFSDRLTISNPGPPLGDINKLIELPPYSRNETLANTMILFRFCEKRGSGIRKAYKAIADQGLPAVRISRSELHTSVTMYPSKKLSEMTKNEKIETCFQHACLLHKDNKKLNNQAVRERFQIDRRNAAVASRIISDTLQTGLIKQSESSNGSKKFISYEPYYA